MKHVIFVLITITTLGLLSGCANNTTQPNPYQSVPNSGFNNNQQAPSVSAAKMLTPILN